MSDQVPTKHEVCGWACETSQGGAVKLRDRCGSYEKLAASPLSSAPDKTAMLHRLQGTRKIVHIVFVFVTAIEGTPLFRGKRHFFWALTDHKNRQ